MEHLSSHTFLFLMVWKWISQTLSTVSSCSKVTKPKPRCLLVCWSINITASSTFPGKCCHEFPPSTYLGTIDQDHQKWANTITFIIILIFFRGMISRWIYSPNFCRTHYVDLNAHVGSGRLWRIPTKIKPLQLR